MTIYYNRNSEKYLRRKLRQEETSSENILWKFLRDRNLHGVKFRRQYSIGKYIIDFYCPELKLALESDGLIHDNPETKENDKIRQSYLESFGIKFIRIKNQELKENSKEVLRYLKEEISSRKRESKVKLITEHGA